MKKRIISLLLVAVMASSSIGTATALAAETTAEEAATDGEETAEEAAENSEAPDDTEISEMTDSEEAADSEEVPEETEEAVTDEIAEEAKDMESSSEQLSEDSDENVLTDSFEGSTLQTEAAVEEEQDIQEEVLEETEEGSDPKTAYNALGMGSVWFGSYYQDKVTDPSEIELIKSEGVTPTHSYGIVSDVPIYCDKNRNYFRSDPVEWIIIRDNGDSYTLLSEKVLWNDALTDLNDSDHFWEGCKLRRYLNSDFYNNCFSDEEKNDVLETAVANRTQTYEQWVNHEEAETTYTYDKVYLLHSDDLEAETASDLVAYPTEYANSNGTALAWWLRGKSIWSYGNEKTNYITSTGGIKNDYPTYTKGVRPVIQVSKDAEGLYFEKPEKKEIINTLMEISAGFEILKDNNSFHHIFSNFHNTNENSYCMSLPFFDLLTKRAYTCKQFLKLWVDRAISEWGGACQGLEITMLLTDNGFHDSFIREAGSFWNIDSPLTVDGLRDTIHYYQLLMQSFVSFDNTVYRDDDLSGFFKLLINEAKHGKPFILNYFRNDEIVLNGEEIDKIKSLEDRKDTDRLTSGHSLIVCGYYYCVSDDGKKEHQLKIYDCNNPNEYYLMHISNDYSLFSFQDYSMVERSKKLNDESRINLSDTFLRLRYCTYNTLANEALPKYFVSKEKPMNEYMLSAERPREVRLASASNGENLPSFSISLNHPFMFTNDAGESLSYDCINTTGNLPVYNYSISDEENSSMFHFDTTNSSSFTITGCEGGISIFAEVGGKAYYVDVDTASKIIIGEESGVSINGDAVNFTSCSLEKSEAEDIICVTGETTGECDIVRDGKKVIVTSDEPVENLEIKLDKNDILTEYTTDASENNYLINNEADELVVTTQNDEGVFVPVEIIKTDGGDVSTTEISSSDVTISGSSFVYTGKEIKPAVTVKVSDDIVLKEGIDFDVTYENNINAGTASAAITGKGNYTGSVTKTFTIKKAANTITTKNVAKSYSAQAQSFDLGVKVKSGTPTYKSNNKSVTVSKAGKVTVKAKFIGNVTITITSPASTNFTSATKSVVVKVVPTKTKFTSATNSASKKMTLKWVKRTNATGYIIQYSTSSKFTNAKTVRVEKNTTVSKTIGNLVKGKRYFVRIKTYKTVNGVKYYSGWSDMKSVKISK